jgi:hypothetical protein
MSTMGKQVFAMFVDKNSPEHWIVRDSEGTFWIVPPIENAWDKREPFEPSEEMHLEPVPGHYRYLLGLPH